MKKRRAISINSILFTGLDLLFLTLVLYTLLFEHYGFNYSKENLLILIKAHYKANILLMLFWVLSSNYSNLYDNNRFTRYLGVLKKVLVQFFTISIFLFAISGVKVEDLFTIKQSLMFIVIIGIYLICTRSIFFYRNNLYRKNGWDDKQIVIIGTNESVKPLERLFRESKKFGLKLKKHYVFKDREHRQEQFDYFSLKSLLDTEIIDYIYICLHNNIDENLINKITSLAEKKYISIGFIPDNYSDNFQNFEISYIDVYPILTYKKYPLDFPLNQSIKRLFDVVFSLSTFVLLLWWLLPLLAIMVYISQGGPILFAQKRNGLNGKEFNCLKFRTMRDDKSNSIKPTERNDPRVTKLGRILRKTSLDELPQFINVLKGEMSIVGPRPHMVSENETYSEIIKRYALRHYVKPGITGLAQVKGYRGAVDSDKDMEMRIRTDIYYVRNWSFLLDLFIIYKTGKLMIFGDENAI